MPLRKTIRLYVDFFISIWSYAESCTLVRRKIIERVPLQKPVRLYVKFYAETVTLCPYEKLYVSTSNREGALTKNCTLVRQMERVPLRKTVR